MSEYKYRTQDTNHVVQLRGHTAPVPGKSTLTSSLGAQFSATPRGEAPPTEAPVQLKLATDESPKPMPWLSAASADPAEPEMVQRKEDASGAADGHQTQAIAAQGISGSGAALSHAGQISESFGQTHRATVEGISAHTDGAAETASSALGAQAYATGSHVALGPSAANDLHTQAHEAAHVVQQKAGAVQCKGGVGEAGDQYEVHADEVADAVVQGKSAAPILDRMSGPGASGAAAVQKKDNLEEEQKEGVLEATGLLYQDILEKQATAINTVYEAQKKAPKPTWDEVLLKLAVTKGLDLALGPLGKVVEGAAGDAIGAAAGFMKSALEKKLHGSVEERVGPALPAKNPALAFFIPLHDSLIDAKHTAQQTFMTQAKPELKAHGSLADAHKIHTALSKQYADVSANFSKHVVDRWMLYLAGARYGVDDSGDTNMNKAKSDMEGGSLGHGPTGTLFCRVFLDGDDKDLANPKFKIGWFDTFGFGEDMWELLTSQNRKVKDFHTDVKIWGPGGSYEYWMGDSGRKMWENWANITISKNASGAVWDDSGESGTAWLELVGYGQPGKVSEAWKRDGFTVDKAKRFEGVRKIFAAIENETVDKDRLQKR